MDIDSLPVIEFTSIKSVVPVFNGRGYLVEFTNKLTTRHWLARKMIHTPVYMSKDAHAALLAYIAQQKQVIEKKDGWGYSTEYLVLGGVCFSSPYFERHSYRAEEAVEQLGEMYVELAAGTSLNARYNWQPVPWDHNHAVMSATPDPDIYLVLSADKGMVTYLRKEFTESQYGHEHLSRQFLQRDYASMDSPVVETDIELINMADRLYSVATTGTFPTDGYTLTLELGLGKLDVAKMNKARLLKLAETLIP